MAWTHTSTRDRFRRFQIHHPQTPKGADTEERTCAISEAQLLDGRLPIIVSTQLQPGKLHVVGWMVLPILCERRRKRRK
eukprot:3732176-Prymnesium_polylepis.1